MMIQAGGDLHAKLHDQRTLVYLAAQHENVPVIHELVRLGLDVQAPTKDGRPALASCLSLKQWSSAWTLLSLGAHATNPVVEATAVGCNGSAVATAFVLAWGGNPAPRVFGETPAECRGALRLPIHALAQIGHTEGCLRLIEQGFDPVRKRSNGLDAIAQATKSGHHETASAMRAQMARRACLQHLGDVACPAA